MDALLWNVSGIQRVIEREAFLNVYPRRPAHELLPQCEQFFVIDMTGSVVYQEYSAEKNIVEQAENLLDEALDKIYEFCENDKAKAISHNLKCLVSAFICVSERIKNFNGSNHNITELLEFSIDQWHAEMDILECALDAVQIVLEK